MQATKFSPKRYTQLQLTKIFVSQAGLPEVEISNKRRIWWVNPTSADSLRLSFHGLHFVKTKLKLPGHEFELPDNLTNGRLLQLERLFQGMYFLLHRKKLIVFDDQEAVMLTLYSADIISYLDNLESNKD